MKTDDVAIPPELAGVLVRTDDTLSGAMRSMGTRVPVQAFIDTIAAGKNLADFLEGFPNVTQEQAEAVLAWEHDQARRSRGMMKRVPFQGKVPPGVRASIMHRTNPTG